MTNGDHQRNQQRRQPNGTAAADIINGLNGNDTLKGFGGADRLDGGNGIDTVFYGDSSAGVGINLATGRGVGGSAQGDTLISIENVFGSNFNDTLTGTSGANQLHGQDGNDVIKGGGGNDFLDGGNGNDILVSSIWTPAPSMAARATIRSRAPATWTP
jgi:Ca2+-binding RTX toxin-like protein